MTSRERMPARIVVINAVGGLGGSDAAPPKVN
jgi:hypothetical protein